MSTGTLSFDRSSVHGVATSIAAVARARPAWQLVLIGQQLGDLSAIRGIPGGAGWVCLPSRVMEWPGDAHGPVISAEIVGADGTSLHVRRSGGVWAGWRYRESPTGPYVKLREERVGTVPGSARTLHYAVYWAARAEDDGVEVLRPHAARFTGWEGA
mgnify:CR=1 FL=1